MSGQAGGAAASQQALVPADASAPIDRDVHPSGIVPTLQNIVATVNLMCKLDLKNIALTARNAEYNPKVGSLATFSGEHICDHCPQREAMTWAERHAQA